jgi:hypothetical protein
VIHDEDEWSDPRSTPTSQWEEPEISFGSPNDGPQAVINVARRRKVKSPYRATTLSDSPELATLLSHRIFCLAPLWPNTKS